MNTINLPVGTATAIGSLPHRQLDAAVAISLAACPDLPAAPSLPRRDAREGMLAQAAWGLRGVEVDGSGNLVVTGALDATVPFADAGLEAPPFEGLRVFLDQCTTRSAPIKLQLTGPLTLGRALVECGVDASTAFAVAGAAVRQRAVAVLERAAAVAPAAPRYLFVDEPSLVAASVPGFPLDANGVVDLMSSALAAIEPLAVTGLHCCGEADWRLALDAGPQILSLPLDAGITAHAGALGVHLDRGGWVAWGAVPTGRPVGDNPARLWRALSETWCELVQRGCDPLRLREQALVTPECGLASHDPVRAEVLLGLSADLAERIRRQAFGVRLSVGA